MTMLSVHCLCIVCALSVHCLCNYCTVIAQTDLKQCTNKKRVSRLWDHPLLVSYKVSVLHDKFIPFSVDIDDFNVFFILQMFAQLGDVNIHASGIEVIVINPDGFQGEVAFKHFIGIDT